MHYGWNNSKSITFQEMGDIFGVTRSMINSIESTAFRKIRQSLWGRNKAKQLFRYELCNGKVSSIPGIIEKMNFAERYLCDEVI
jgi:hypothetical protein